MQDTEPTGTLDELPIRVQQLIRKLRIENRQLKDRIRDTPRLEAQGLPVSWQKKFADLRTENARNRIQRNEARAELAALLAERV